MNVLLTLIKYLVVGVLLYYLVVVLVLGSIIKYSYDEYLDMAPKKAYCMENYQRQYVECVDLYYHQGKTKEETIKLLNQK